MTDIDKDKVVYVRTYVPKWVKICYAIMLAPVVIIVGGLMLLMLSFTLAML